MAPSEDDVFHFIYTAAFALSVGAALGAFLTRHPLLIGLALSLFLIAAIIKYAFETLRETFGMGANLLFSIMFLAPPFFLLGRETKFEPIVEGIFVVVFWGSLILSYLFLKAFVKSFFKKGCR
jgi:hypothetical protein